MKISEHSENTGWEYARSPDCQSSQINAEQEISAPVLNACIDLEENSDFVKIAIDASRKQNSKALLLTAIILTTLVLSIGIMFALFGAWIILPFAGFEIVALGVCTYLVFSQNKDKDCLTISANYVHLTQIRRSKRTVCSFIRQWTRVQLQKGNTRHEPVKLLIGCHGQFQELGVHLVYQSKRHVHQTLTSWINND